MAGLGSRHPADKMRRLAGSGQGPSGRQRRGMFSPGFGNVFLCYLLVCSLVLAPVALIFSVRFADSTEQRLFAHYFFIRTTIAVFVIGTCVSCLLILIGADLSSSLILAGLALLTITSALTLIRCFRGIFSALRGNSPRFYRSYLA